MKNEITVALAGNPNSGKTTVYNALTGAKGHIGNYPGVTVEKKEADITHKGTKMKVIDLPGTYSLTAYSVEEVVARNVIIEEKPDVIVNIIDASNLERNLYLTVQLMELRVPLVLVFNMADLAKKMGLKMNLQKLSQLMGVPILEAVGSKNIGLQEILDEAIKVANNSKATSYSEIKYDNVIEKNISLIQEAIQDHSADIENYNSRWLAVKLLENDKDVEKIVPSAIVGESVKAAKSEIKSILGEESETAIGIARYGFISGVCQQSIEHSVESRHNMSDSIDAVLVNRLLGIPIFILLMYLVFQLTFTIGDPFMGWIEEFFGWLGATIDASLEGTNMEVLRSLLVDGIIGGVGGVIVFLPNIILLFIAIAILEASGYMARVAFIMDRVMNSLGLHGKAFIPMIIGFGCSIPAIMATRTLESQRDRIITMLVIPFMSCGARLPIYSLIIPAFFSEKYRGLALLLIYLLGIVMAIISAKILSSTVLKGETTPFVMELPPYRRPTLRGVLSQMWERAWLYLKKAGTIILGISVVMWALTYFPRLDDAKIAEFAAIEAPLQVAVDESQKVLEDKGYVFTDSEDEAEIAKVESINEKLIEEDANIAKLLETYEANSEKLLNFQNDASEYALENSIAGSIGKFIAPVFAPIGFDWKIVTALIGAFAAKEVFVAQLGIVYSVGEADETSESLRNQLQTHYNIPIAISIMVFALLSTPCMATFAIVKRESNSWKWPVFQLVAMTVVAYIMSFIIYNISKLFV